MEEAKRKMTEKEMKVLEKKKGLVKFWEETIKEKSTEVFTEDGLKFLYSPETCISEVQEMLIEGAKAVTISRALDKLIGNIDDSGLSSFVEKMIEDGSEENVRVVVAKSKEDALEKLKELLFEGEEDSCSNDNVDALLKGACSCGGCAKQYAFEQALKFAVMHECKQVGSMFSSFEDANEYALRYSLSNGVKRKEIQILEVKGNPTID